MMRYHINERNVLELIDRAAAVARIAAPRGPWRDKEYRLTFAEWDADRITGALGWILATAGLESIDARRAIARLSNQDGLPYHLWPSTLVQGALLFEPDISVMRALDAACESDPHHAAIEASAAMALVPIV